LGSYTVYVLGAGFSYDAKVPLQANILERLKGLNLAIEKPGSDFYEQIPMELAIEFRDAWRKIQSFLDGIFSQVSIPSLEDVFTLLDQTIEKRGYCVGMTWKDLETIRTALYKAVVILFRNCEDAVKDELDFYNAVALHFINKRIKAGQANKPFSIVSLNWDCVIENTIYRCIKKLKKKNIDIDYCCYTYPFEGIDKHTPSILQRAKGIFNIKIMKLHGSVNWLLCPNCNRLYVGLGASSEKLSEYTIAKICPECEKAYNKTGQDDYEGPILEPFIISPTFVKQFDNVHIQMVWHNAYMDLYKADKIIFIGYSLPEADYHLRTLLKRAIQPNTKIDVVLIKSDRCPKVPVFRSISHKYAESRYKAFFGQGKNIRFYFNGVKGYFNSLPGH